MKPFSTGILRKFLMALTGLGLCVFLVAHLAGNLLIFGGAEAFNTYSHKLVSNPFVLIPLEVGLLGLFLYHIYLAIRVTVTNRRARPHGYHEKKRAGHPSRKSLASSTMIFSGLLVLVFTVIHLKTFKYGPHYESATPGVRDLHRLVLEVFSNPFYVAWYVLCMILLGLHLAHGFSSAFQSLGVDHPRLTPKILALGKIFALVIAGGFLSLPVWVFFAGGAP